MGVRIIFIMFVYIQKSSIYINNILYSHACCERPAVTKQHQENKEWKMRCQSAKLTELRGLLLISRAHFAF